MTADLQDFVIEVAADGVVVGSAPASVAACVDDLYFRAVLNGELPNDGVRPRPVVTPRWSDDEPSAVTSLAISLPPLAERHYDRDVFAAQTSALISQLSASQRIPKDAHLSWRVTATPAAPSLFSARATRAPYPFRTAAMPELSNGEYAVRFEADLMHDARAFLGTPDVERAALLRGALRHDAARGALELQVQRAIELEPGTGGASSSHFAFSPGSFAAASRAAEAEDDGLISCGWVHSHPPCGDCMRNDKCEVDWVFFSSDDIAVHTSAFASPYMVGLVVGKVGALPARRPGFRLYGWSGGRVRERDFGVAGVGAESWIDAERSFREEIA